MNKPDATSDAGETPRTDALIGELSIEAASFRTMYYEAMDYWNTMSEHARTLERELSAATARSEELLRALELPLIFHAGGYWSKEMGQRWAEITGDRDATTKVMCDYIRAAIGRKE